MESLQSLKKPLESNAMKWRKRLFVATVMFRNFLTATEYSVVMPTVYLYMQQIGHGKVITGLVIGMYPLGSMIGMPTSGFIYDKTMRIRELMHGTAALQMIGSVMFALPYSVAFPLLGRFISGLGFSFLVCVTGEVTYLYPGSERLRIMSLVELGRALGLFAGPGMVFLIKDVDFEFYGWKITQLNMPGLLMAFLWLLLQIVSLYTMRNTAKNIKMSKEKEIKESSYLDSSAVDEDRHLKTALTDQEENAKDESQPFLKCKQDYWSVLREACCSVEFGVIFYVEVLSWFILELLFTLIVYIPEIDFTWSASSTSSIFIANGLAIIMVFTLISAFSKRYPVHESYLLTLSMSIAQLSLIFFTIEASSAPSRMAKIILYYGTVVCIWVFAPLNMVCARTLVTKLYPAEVQGMLQAVFSTCSRIAMVIAPLSVSALYNSRIPYFSMLSFLNVISVIFLLACKRRFMFKESGNKERSNSKHT